MSAPALTLRRRAMGPFSAAGATAGVIIITVYLSAPAFVLQRAIQPTPAVAVTRPAENGGAEVTFDELRWLAREAEIKCDEWIAAKPAGDPEGAQRLAFELSCRCAHRREKVRKVFENFIQANPEHRGAKAEFEQFSRAIVARILRKLGADNISGGGWPGCPDCAEMAGAGRLPVSRLIR